MLEPKDYIDVKGGELTFGQRISLGHILANDSDDVLIKSINVIECLHEFRPKYKQLVRLQDYILSIIDGIRFWTEQEATLLKYEPTPEEIKAGIKDLSVKIGEFGTVKALAKAYNTDPDVILTWKYGKVFGILFTDLEENKFSRRFQKVIESKNK